MGLVPGAMNTLGAARIAVLEPETLGVVLYYTAAPSLGYPGSLLAETAMWSKRSLREI